tara:strand:- start:271 stop:495 length:225 start_codon:yes stop_codon:yes gene_type:complete
MEIIENKYKQLSLIIAASIDLQELITFETNLNEVKKYLSYENAEHVEKLRSIELKQKQVNIGLIKLTQMLDIQA